MPHTIIAGMGPAGLSACLALLLKGHKVTLIEKRSEYTLRQKIYIDEKIINLFEHIMEGHKGVQDFISHLRGKKNIISIKKFEEFYLKMLEEIIINKSRFQYEGKKITGTLEVLRGEDFKVVKVDGDTQTITLQNGMNLSFDNIIDATGSNRHIVSLLAESSNQKYKIKFVQDLSQPVNPANAVLSFKCNVPQTRRIKPMDIKKIDECLPETFEKLGWKQNYYPLYYIRSSAEKEKIYMVVEIPAALLGITDKKKVIEFIEPILQKEFQMSINPPAILEQDTTTISTFSVTHEIAETPYTRLGKSGFAIVLGDALAPANLHFAHGVPKAIQDGFTLMKAFDEKGTFISQILHKRVEDIRYEIEGFCGFQYELIAGREFQKKRKASPPLLLAYYKERVSEIQNVRAVESRNVRQKTCTPP